MSANGSSRRRPRRKQVVTGFEPDFDPHFAVYDPDVVERLYLRERLRSALAAIPERRAEAVCMHDRDGYGYDEIAVALKTSPGAARVLYHRGRKDLRRLLADIAPVIVFIVVLSLIVALAHLYRVPIEPTRIPFLPRSQSGVFIAPEPVQDCTVRDASRERKHFARGLTVSIEPIIRARGPGGHFLATVVFSNTSRHAVNQTITAIRPVVYSPDQRLVLTAAPAELRQTVTIVPGATQRVPVELVVPSCTLNGSLFKLSAKNYFLKVVVSGHNATSDFTAASRITKLRVVTYSAPPPEPRATVYVRHCDSLPEDKVFFGALGDLGEGFRVALSPDESRATSPGELLISMSLSNTLGYSRRLGVAHNGVVSRSLRDAAAIITVPPKQTITIRVVAALSACGRNDPAKFGQYVAWYRRAPFPQEYHTASGSYHFFWICTYCEWPTGIEYASGTLLFSN